MSPWPHRLAVALALVTFPLIWVGGLVTTYDAGMAVPDWPSTYGYNLFLYPWQTWMAGPWDLFIEHGHRLLGALAGLLALTLLAAVWMLDRRRWLVWAAAGGVALVVLQGVLGGLRVLLDARWIALLHGCTGPLFFAYLGGLLVATSRGWEAAATCAGAMPPAVLRSSSAEVWGLVALGYGQLVLGALVRHMPVTARPELFRAALGMHVILAGAVLLAAVHVAWRLRGSAFGTGGPGLLRRLLVILVALQIVLGGATYVAHYAFPAWLGGYRFAASYVVAQRSLGQSLITTAHVANGSLILLVAVVLAVRLSRWAWVAQRASREVPVADPQMPRPLLRRRGWLEGVPV